MRPIGTIRPALHGTFELVFGDYEKGMRMTAQVTGLLVLLGFLGLLCIIAWQQVKWARSCRAGAEKMYREMAAMYRGAHEYRVASEGDVPGLELSGYHQAREFLLGRSFRYLGSFENITATAVHPEYRTLVDAYASDDGSVGVGSYRIQDIQTLEFSTILKDGRSLVTTNAHLDTLTPPPSVSKCILPRNTLPQDLLSRHLARFGALRDAEPSLELVRLTSLDDVLAICRRNSRVASEHRQSLGLLNEAEMLNFATRRDQEATARRIWRHFHTLVARDEDVAEQGVGADEPQL